MNQLSSITPLEIILIALAAVGIFFFFRVCWRNIKRSRQHLGVALLTLMMTLTAQTATAAVGDVVDSGTCGTNLTWTLTDNGGTVTLSDGDYSTLTLTITGTGAMYDYTSSTRPWGTADNIRYRITTLNLPEGITHIGDYAFYFNNFTGKLTIPSTVKTIGDRGFYSFFDATSVTIPASVTSIGEMGFLGYGGKVSFAEGSLLTSIGANAFEKVGGSIDMTNCTKLTAITAENVFMYFEKTVTFPKTLTSVCANAFKTVSNKPKPKVAISYQGFLVINGGFQSYSENVTTETITDKFNIKTNGSKAVTIFQRSDGLTQNTEGSYYEVNSEQGLVNLGDLIEADTSKTIAGMTFKLTADLDFTNMPTRSVNGNSGNFHPIGLVENKSFNGCFSGHFDGQNHTIKGLSYTNKFASGSNNNEPVGLFKKVYGNSAVVERVLLIYPQMSGKPLGCGGIAGLIYNGATIRNCTVLGGSIVRSNGESGGIVGTNIEGGAATIEGCTVIGTSVQDGMIIGYANSQQTIKDCIYYAPDGMGICRNNYTDGGGNSQVYQVTLGENVTATDATYTHALLPGKAYYAEGATVTLAADREGYVFLGYTATGVTLSGSATSFTMPASDVTIGAEWADPADISVNAAGTEYTIHTAEGWGVFCDLLEGGTSFTGKTVYLDKDISVTRMAGSSSHKFTGTFDGQGNVLTVSYGTEGTPINEQYAAPFSYVDGATIQNLSINGDIYTSAKYAAGIVSSQYGTVSISNCRVSINIHSSISGDGTHAGFVALNNNDATLNIEGCVFSGKLLTTNGTYRCAGYVGWRSGTVNISNSLYAPATLGDGETWAGTSESATFVRNGGTTITNSYYTADFNDGSKFTAQGKQARSITAGEYVTVANAGNATEYTVSSITSYGAGIKYGSNLYAGCGDEVSLTLSHGDREGYTFDGYTASAGTLSGDANPYTLTMPDENVTIGATFTKSPVTTSYVDANGTLHENVIAIPLDNTMTTLAAGWYVVNEDVTFTSKITLDGDVNLILGDGKTMTVTNTGTDHEDRAIYGNEKTLHIYGQRLGTGALTATAVGGESAIFLETSHDNAGSLLGIHGGVVSASTECASGVAISVQCATDAGGIVIDGGQVTASGKSYGIFCFSGHFDVIGGQVTATGTNGYGLGICDYGTNPGVLTLGYSKASDFVSTNSIYNYSGESSAGEVKIADDQTLVDGNGNIWSGTLSNDEIQSIHNQTLRPVTGVALTKDGNGTTATFSGTSADELNIPVAVEVDHVDVDRTFAANKACTLYLPFGIAASKVSGGKFYTFTAVNESTTPWSVEYDEVTGDIEANTPYIFLPDGTNSGKIVVDNGSDKVSVSTANPHTTVQGQWEFVGTYEPIRWLSDNERAAEIGKIYGFAAKDKTVGETSYTVGQFVKIASGASIKPMRAYLKRTTVSGTRTMTRGVDDSLPSTMTVVLKGSSGNTTEIGTISLDDEAGEWYSLDGRKLSGKPTKKGLYINGGKKIVIK